MVGREEVKFGENVPILKRSTLDLVFRSNLVFSPIPALPLSPNTLTAIDSTRVCLEDYHMQILAEEVQMFYHRSAVPHSVSVLHAHYVYTHHERKHLEAHCSCIATPVVHNGHTKYSVKHQHHSFTQSPHMRPSCTQRQY